MQSSASECSPIAVAISLLTFAPSCDECQKMHGSAMHWSVALEKEKVHFKCDSDKLHFYRTSDKKTVHELPCKVSCNRCHSHLCDEGRNMMLM